MDRIFLLSPAHCGGKRASFLFNDTARFDLARQIRSAEGAALEDVFAFLSGLYFRGKIAYANGFTTSTLDAPGSYVITTNRGLLSPQTRITIADLRAMGCNGIDALDLR